jgi:hypothetical protein
MQNNSEYAATGFNFFIINLLFCKNEGTEEGHFGVVEISEDRGLSEKLLDFQGVICDRSPAIGTKDNF